MAALIYTNLISGRPTPAVMIISTHVDNAIISLFIFAIISSTKESLMTCVIYIAFI